MSAAQSQQRNRRSRPLAASTTSIMEDGRRWVSNEKMKVTFEKENSDRNETISDVFKKHRLCAAFSADDGRRRDPTHPPLCSLLIGCVTAKNFPDATNR
ncbi:hypothetical protein F2P81_023000 [Scophthalmus maximus]|uniref:Uncharacterized protein n=1 Tax=Scophthalmus maximus TaxID=52904 RepID=A0A6A4RWA1_SCOMX|nr:hypothetical protein F2P81_023000 [Scophthalmus maximus]